MEHEENAGRIIGGFEIMPVTIKNFRKLSDKYNKLKRIYQDLSTSLTPYPHELQKKCVKSQSEFDAYRENVANNISKSIPILEQLINLRNTLAQIKDGHGYVDITITCSNCKTTFTETRNVYEEYNFEDALCLDCVNRQANKDEVSLIETGENYEGVYSDDGDLIGIQFDNDGKRYFVGSENKHGNYDILSIEVDS
jgi:hypothetical protein